MLERALRFLAITLSLFIVAGFTLFALEDSERASVASRDRITGVDAIAPTAAGERAREQRHGQVREAIDDVDDVLLSPFASLTENSDSRWAQRGVPTLLGLLVYGFGLGFVARFATARSGRPRTGGQSVYG